MRSAGNQVKPARKGKTLAALERAALDAAMAVYGEVRKNHPATHMAVVEDLIGSYMTPASVQQIRACNSLYNARLNARAASKKRKGTK